MSWRLATVVCLAAVAVDPLRAAQLEPAAAHVAAAALVEAPKTIQRIRSKSRKHGAPLRAQPMLLSPPARATPPPKKSPALAQARPAALPPQTPPPQTPPPPPQKLSAPAAAPPSISVPVALAGPPRPGADLDKCLSCHQPLIANRKEHQPLRGGDCSACHVAAPAATTGKCKSPKGSAWVLTAAQPALCAKCHDKTGATPLHPVIKAMGCTACHDPHASSNPSLSKVWPAVAQCYKCHTKYDDAEFIHTAVKKGDCLGCHNPHAGEARPLLIDQREALCSSCHKPASLFKGHDKHAPVVEGRCLDCHDPHRSDYKGQLLEKGKKLCLTCHDSKAKPKPGTASEKFRIDLTKKVVHKPLATGDCQDCHTQQHSSDEPALLNKSVAETCFKCHTRFDQIYKFQHGAAKVGDCAVCHDPHSSDNKSLLVTSKVNELCFNCHQDDVTRRKWIHQPIKDKGCTACHDAHGADYRFNLTDGDGPELCLKCHKGVGEHAKVPHKALARYGCVACHDPHGSDNEHGLLKATNELCTSCHQQQSDSAHFGLAHKVEGGPDPKRPGRPFSCTSCHAAHGSNNPKLLYSGKDAQTACTYCHADRFRAPGR